MRTLSKELNQERKLLEDYAAARKAEEMHTRAAENFKKIKQAKEQLIVELLIAKNAKKTAEFNGLGFARIRDEQIKTVNFPKDKEGELFTFVRKHEHGDIIKQSINHQTLKSFVKTCLEEEIELPKFIFYETERKITFYDRSK